MAGRWMRGRQSWQSLPPWLSTAWILSVSVVGIALGTRVNVAAGLFVLFVGMPLGGLLMIVVMGRRNGDRR
jgi:CHASE2 domain-containing sensor protein